MSAAPNLTKRMQSRWRMFPSIETGNATGAAALTGVVGRLVALVVGRVDKRRMWRDGAGKVALEEKPDALEVTRLHQRRSRTVRDMICCLGWGGIFPCADQVTEEQKDKKKKKKQTNQNKQKKKKNWDRSVVDLFEPSRPSVPWTPRE